MVVLNFGHRDNQHSSARSRRKKFSTSINEMPYLWRENFFKLRITVEIRLKLSHNRRCRDTGRIRGRKIGQRTNGAAECRNPAATIMRKETRRHSSPPIVLLRERSFSSIFPLFLRGHVLHACLTPVITRGKSKIA